MSERIRILIVDDHSLVRKGLRMLISGSPDMEVVGEASNGVEAVEQSQAVSPDVILMDLQMPRMGGIEAIREIKKRDPQMKILVLTSFADDDKVFPAIKEGASGYLLKDSLPSELMEAIQAIHQGQPFLHPMITERLMRGISHPEASPAREEKLTRREVEVLKQVAAGKSNHEIAEKLVVSERTIDTHLGSILSKLHLSNRTQAALYAIKEGWVDPPAKE
jgi:two-component system, NarL family, response regulator LiaR